MTRNRRYLLLPSRQPLGRRGLTLVEMLVAISISLLMMAAVVTVFANISGSISRRRATIEMASSLRSVRETLARDLAGATCPAVPDQRPESNHGYLEIIEGPQNDFYPTPWIWDGDNDGVGDPISNTPGVDLSLSSLPGSNLRHAGTPDDEEGAGLTVGPNQPLPEEAPTDARGLGDGDDILMLTVRNETDPFVGRIPLRSGPGAPSNTAFPLWQAEEVESQLAEVAWFAVENPVERSGAQTFAFGEPGYRTIYRRALLILPDLDYRIDVTESGVDYGNQNTTAGRLAGPGVVRVLAPAIGRPDVSQALASLIAFQEQYDLSVHLEWDPLLPDSTLDDARDAPGRWVIRANTLGSLTKRENRYEHHGYVGESLAPQAVIDLYVASNLAPSYRAFPYPVASGGRFNAGPIGLSFVNDIEVPPPGDPAAFRSVVAPIPGAGSARSVVAYEPTDDQILAQNRRYSVRPFVVPNYETDTPATARAILNEDGHVVHVTRGLAPLGGARRGDDVMLTGALAFDLRVYDPGAPVYAYYTDAANSQPVQLDQTIEPSDPAWASAFNADAPWWLNAGATPPLDPIGNLSPTTVVPFVFQRRGAYVDLGYGSTFLTPSGAAANIGTVLPAQRFFPRSGNQALFATSPVAQTMRFFTDGAIRTPGSADLTTFYRTYDTWSWHYETNGLNEDRDSENVGGVLRPMIDEGTNGFDDLDPTDSGDLLIAEASDRRFNGPDDPAEREAPPPYETALRGVQAMLRVYEPDSRQIREVRVRESFLPE
ncbi:prepilin-type N-terminal cleavage/methylation domain-containing protein [Botrimarina sp.]|uniref:PilW family protein n=1 Tax=Botrimarina sp. TaxID=2795802 RepID=UPI0032EFE024